MIVDDLPKPFFVLAPMDDVTDTVFRQIIASLPYGPDLFFTEFVNVDGLQSPGREKLLPKLQFTNTERPLVAQLWGKKPENFYKTAQQIVDGSLAEEIEQLRMRNKGGDGVQGSGEARSKAYKAVRRTSTGDNDTAIRPKHGSVAGSAGQQAVAPLSFAGVDINFGCPERTVIKNGCCIAMINNRELAGEIIQAVREAVGPHFPVSVKTRLGLGEVDYSWHELLLGHKLNMLTIHGRTAKQLSKVPADWQAIEHVRELRDQLSPATLIIGNGDVMDRAQGERLAKQHGLDGIMIGRGIFDDPFAFAARSPWPRYTREQKVALYKKHVQLFAHTWKNNERKVYTLNKFCKVYINGFDGAKELRDRLMHAKTTDELLVILSKS